MTSRVMLVVFDGLGDRPIPQFGGKTPLEAASTPVMDRLAGLSECGLMLTLGRGVVPGSDVAHLSLLGYDLKQHYSGRGTIEVAGIGIDLLEGDVALRGNFGTVGDANGELVIKDRRAGRIRDVAALAQAIDGYTKDGVTFIVKPGTAHRAGVVMRGEGLSNQISDMDPHVENTAVRRVQATENTPEAHRTARALNGFFDEACRILADHPLNASRTDAGKPAANCLLVRGAGQFRKVPSFHERHGLSACCVAGAGLYKGMGAYLGMTLVDVPGATGLPDTDAAAKFRAAADGLKTHDFVFLHIKAADSLGEDGNFEEKKQFIERCDTAAEPLTTLPDDTLVVITADHSTPCELRRHSADPVPLLFCGRSVRADAIREFGERACAAGGLGILHGSELMGQIKTVLGTLPLTGA